ncbi:MAG: DUF1828 domain-containing protein [Candidatus Tectimicrobiota bacterium]
MMDVPSLENTFRQQMNESIRLVADGPGRYRIAVPLTFDDGDYLIIVLKQLRNQWVLSDEGHTYMHLSYNIDASRLLYGTRRQIIVKTLRMFQVQEHGGELILPIDYDDYAEALWSVVQALLKIIDIAYLSQERARSTFLEDFQAFFEEMVAPERRIFAWYDAAHDPEKRYVVDCRINGVKRPLFIYALTNDDRVRDATIGIAHFVREGFTFYSVGIFEDQMLINRRVLARFTDICDRQFPNLSSSRGLIEKFFTDALRGELPVSPIREHSHSEAENDHTLLFTTGK